MKVLFLNHPESKCGVWDFGKWVCDALSTKPAGHVVYCEVKDASEYEGACAREKPDVVVVNYTPATMSWWSARWQRRSPAPCVGILHEFDDSNAHRVFTDRFDIRWFFQPTMRVARSIDHVFPRPLRGTHLDSPTRVDCKIPRIGSFGFATGNKLFEDLVVRAQKELGKVEIRLNLPFAEFGDRNGDRARAVEARCRKLLHVEGARLQVSHDLLSSTELLEFLCENDMNVFFYRDQVGRGISSCLDYAFSVPRPVALNRCSMFRHLQDTGYPHFVEDKSLSDILRAGPAAPSGGLYAAPEDLSKLLWRAAGHASALRKTVELRRFSRRAVSYAMRTVRRLNA